MSTADTYDVVIVGSGLGGMLCGVILAREGMKVCVLEKNRQSGGCLQTFSFRKKVFDSCVHYIGGLAEGHVQHRIFSYAGIMDRLKVKQLDPEGYDRICFGDRPEMYPLAAGQERFAERLTEYFPGSRDSLRRYTDTLNRVAGKFPLYNLRAGDPSEKEAVSHWELAAVLSDLVPDPLLRQVLLGNSLLYAGRQGITPFYLHALVLGSYMHGAYKVQPGSSMISKLLGEELRRHGGVLFRNAEVMHLEEQGGLVRYAETEDGRRFYAKRFISNLHPLTLQQLTRSTLLRPAYRKRMELQEQTVSAFMLNLVLEPGKLACPDHNIYWHAGDTAWGADRVAENWPQSYALYFNEDPACPGYAESLSVLTYMDFAAMQPWADTRNHSGRPGSREPGYAAVKEGFSEQLLEKVYERVPGLKGCIRAHMAATPLTFRDYLHTPGGGMYGIMKDVRNPHGTTVSVRTRIPNLLQTGQNVNLHGVLGVSITSVATCAEWLGMDYLLGRIS